MIFDTAKENTSMAMAVIIMEIGSKVKCKGKENSTIQMEISNTKANGKTTTTTAKESYTD